MKTKNLVFARSAFVELFMTMMETTNRSKQDGFVKDLKWTYGTEKGARHLPFTQPIEGP